MRLFQSIAEFRRRVEIDRAYDALYWRMRVKTGREAVRAARLARQKRSDKARREWRGY